MYLYSIVYAENMRTVLKKQRQSSLASTRTKPFETKVSPGLELRDRRTIANPITALWHRMLAALVALLVRQNQN